MKLRVNQGMIYFLRRVYFTHYSIVIWKRLVSLKFGIWGLLLHYLDLKCLVLKLRLLYEGITTSSLLCY